MNLKMLCILMLVPFLGLTGYALYDVGFIGIFDYVRHSSAGWQVFSDLVIALVIVLVFLIRDARANGRNPWPWVIGTLFTGSIAPLFYFATESTKASVDRGPDAV